MTREEALLRRVAVLAAGLAMTTSLGLAVVDSASAASPALHIKPGSLWMIKSERGGCENETFEADHTFSADRYGDSGTWSGSGATVSMRWTAGTDTGVTFGGTFTTTPVRNYVGFLHSMTARAHAHLIKGSVPGC
jgi:hypothetical protein